MRSSSKTISFKDLEVDAVFRWVHRPWNFRWQKVSEDTVVTYPSGPAETIPADQQSELTLPETKDL